MHRTRCLEELADIHGTSGTTTENLARVTNDAENGAGTRMGKGSRAHVQAPFLASLTFSLAVRDAKNAAAYVSAFARMRLDSSKTRAVMQTETVYNEFGRHAEVDHTNTATFSRPEFVRANTPFLALIEKIKRIADPTRQVIHQEHKARYRIDVHLSPVFRVELFEPFPQAGLGRSAYVRFCYEATEADAKLLNPTGRHPSPRMVSITAEQVEAAGAIFADTLAHDLARAPNLAAYLKLPTPEAPTASGSKAQNNNAGNPCDTVPAGVQPNQSPTDGFPCRQHNAREKRKFKGSA